MERGKSVEDRGADIGALVVRKLLDPESNFCYGEGGAGTWSDGKLTTKIGKNSGARVFWAERCWAERCLCWVVLSGVS